jgi:hypothetical protein
VSEHQFVAGVEPVVSGVGQETDLRPTASQRATVRVMAERRWRLWRRLAVIVVVSAVIVLLALLQRDTQSRRGFERDAERLAAEFEGELARRGVPPDIFLFAQRDDPAIAEFYFNTSYSLRFGDGEAVGVCCMRAPLGLFLQEDGRYVILFDGKSFAVRWMTESEFRSRAPELGLASAVSH